MSMLIHHNPLPLDWTHSATDHYTLSCNAHETIRSTRSVLEHLGHLIAYTIVTPWAMQRVLAANVLNASEGHNENMKY